MPSEDENARLLRQQAEDLGNHRITALPLGDRQPGRRGVLQRSSRPAQGAGDARFDLRPRPRGAPPGSSVRRVEVEQRWLAVFDDSMVIERPDGIGGGALHRVCEMLSSPRLETWLRETLLALPASVEEVAVYAHLQALQAARGTSPRVFNLVHNLVDRSFHRNLALLAQGSLEMKGNWGAPGLVHDQGTFFDKMTKNTGLRCPPIVKNQQEAPKNAKPFAKPMPSAKDLSLEATGSQIENPIQSTEPSNQPARPQNQPAEQPKAKPSTSVFIPPHLRHALKKQTAGSKAGGKPIELKVSQPVVNRTGRELLLPVEEAARLVPRASPLARRSVSHGGSPLVRPQLLPAPEEPRNPLASAPKPRGDFPPFNFPLPIDFPISAEFATQFWNLVAKPLWEQLLEDYDDVQQQIIFLTWYYAEKPHEWKHVMKTGPPTREMILKISEEYMDEDQKAILAYRKAQENKFKNVLSPKLGSAPQPPSSWWKIDAADSAAISEWAGKLQESHRNAMLESLKERVAEERDSVQTQILYSKMGMLMHEGKEGPSSFNSGAQGQKLNKIPKLPAKVPVEPSNEKDGDVSVLVLDPEGSKELKEKNLSSLIKLMWDHGLDPEGDFLTEDDFPLTAEQQASPEPEWLPPLSPSPPPPLALATPTPPTSTAAAAAPNVPPPSPPSQNRFGVLASIHSSTPLSRSSAQIPHKGRHRGHGGQHAPQDLSKARDPMPARGTVSAPAPRDPSDERRQREKQERMKEIDKKFASAKSGQTLGADGHQEFTPLLLEFPAHLLNFGPDTVVQLVPDDAMEDTEDTESNQSFEEENSFLDDEEPLALDDIIVPQPEISEEEICRIREMNRDSVPELAITCPWSFGLRFASPVRPGECFTVKLDCTARMPADFLKQLRDKIGVEHWEVVSSHPGFRTVVAHATKAFYIKMTRKWGPRFIHGIAD
ncbi:uncharacterized protein DFL_000245 [Arthrobotrys flagrans]|uniref:Uncharacterized protein n=1 Tax=Arthrobotrys flagrans TaxID=97331 RepID=A0A437ADN2_ARTFL|nr:hypothetical protein DFL_000245 [Arthrobotrys flagrans]